MPRAKANGIELEYETFGDRADAPLLLIMGLGAQLITWRAEFCAMLAAAGFYVIRFDNRDSGLSTKMDEAGPPDLAAAYAGEPRPAYQLDDLARDAVGLLDALGIEKAHIVGASMGGYIAQLVAINHPDRTLSLTSIMSGPANSEAAPPTPEALAVLVAAPPATREERIAQEMWARKVLLGSADPFDEAYERGRAERHIDRAYHPVGTARQFMAILAAPPRLERLATLRVPTLVIHGVDDVLIPIENGRLVAAAVPGARLMEIEGMGHDLPQRVWPQFVDAMVELARDGSALKS
ncbi:MAG TPA: alpha/beta fold hydrolase [Candidatus Dormibacteraeota bacterium]